MNRIVLFITLILMGGVFTGLYAQNQAKGLSIAGTVMDEKGIEMPGVSVVVKNESRGTVTNIDGKFRIGELASGTIIDFSFIGYVKQEYKLTKTEERLKIVMKEDINEMDEVVITGRGTQRKISIVGAMTSIDPKELQVPSPSSVSNMLGGRVPGIISVSRSGEPGKDFSEFWIRGISTFGANQSALILIDGTEGNLNDLDPEDIESFTVLKDASATAVYGVRGANGVVIVSTKRGKAGKLNVSFKTNTSYSYSPREPQYLGASDYASLANEAAIGRGNRPIYSDVEIELFKTGLDPDLYPDINWRDVILKDHTYYNQQHLSLSGGGSNMRYYVSLGIQNKDAILKQDETANQYKTNIDYNRYNLRINVDINLGKTTTLSSDIEGVVVTQNSPGYGDDNDAIWTAQANLTPVTVPVRYSNGLLPAYGANSNQISPYVLLNYTGYKNFYRNTNIMKLRLDQNFDFITKGLSASMLGAVTSNGTIERYRRKMPDLYYASDRLSDGSLNVNLKVTKQEPTFSQESSADRKYYFEFRTNYNRKFGSHHITGLLHYYMEDFITSTSANDLLAVPKRYQAYSGRATYAYLDTYFLELNAGYTGSEAFKSGEQFGLFPAISGGWVPTQYQWVKTNMPFVNFFKIRASFGKVGNDRITNVRFPYLTTMTSAGSGVWASGSGLTESQVGSDNLRWETATKSDVGIDLTCFKERISLTVDFFNDHRTGIYQQRADIPEETGLVSLPWANIGSMRSWGTDGNISFTQSLGKSKSLVFRANYTYAKNKIINWEQSGIIYPYQSSVGKPYNVLRGLISLGLFEDENDIASSPKQTFMTNVLPGDIKYKDVNGDGKVDNDDIVPLSYSTTPQIQYGFATEFNWKNWSFSAFFEGTSKVNFFYQGDGFYPYVGRNTGNVLSIVGEQENRWTPASYSGTTETENPNARFPRLTYGNNLNNNRASTFWLADAGYIRLKNAQIAYRLNSTWLRNNLKVEGATFSLSGDNLACWDKVKLWDPAQASSNGAVYPLQRTITFQMSIKF